MEVLGRIPFLSIFRKFSTQITFMPKTLHTRLACASHKPHALAWVIDLEHLSDVDECSQQDIHQHKRCTLRSIHGSQIT